MYEGSLIKYIGEKSFEIHRKEDMGNNCEENKEKPMGGKSCLIHERKEMGNTLEVL